MITSIKVGSEITPTKLLNVREYLEISRGKLTGKFKEAIISAMDDRGFGDLPKHIAEQVIGQLMVESLNKSITITKQCECGKTVVAHADTHNIMTSDEEDLKFDFGEIKFQLKYPKLFEDEDLLEMFNRCIVYVDIKGSSIAWQDLSETEMAQVIECLEFSSLQKMVSALLKPTVYVAIPVKCECGEIVPVVASGLTEILNVGE